MRDAQRSDSRPRWNRRARQYTVAILVAAALVLPVVGIVSAAGTPPFVFAEDGFEDGDANGWELTSGYDVVQNSADGNWSLAVENTNSNEHANWTTHEQSIDDSANWTVVYQLGVPGDIRVGVHETGTKTDGPFMEISHDYSDVQTEDPIELVTTGNTRTTLVANTGPDSNITSDWFRAEVTVDNSSGQVCADVFKHTTDEFLGSGCNGITPQNWNGTFSTTTVDSAGGETAYLDTVTINGGPSNVTDLSVALPDRFHRNESQSYQVIATRSGGETEVVTVDATEESNRTDVLTVDDLGSATAKDAAGHVRVNATFVDQGETFTASANTTVYNRTLEDIRFVDGPVASIAVLLDMGIWMLLAIALFCSMGCERIWEEEIAIMLFVAGTAVIWLLGFAGIYLPVAAVLVGGSMAFSPLGPPH